MSEAPAPPPDEAELNDAAMRHLARYAATEAGLLRVLRRRIDRWAATARRAGLDPTIAAELATAARPAAVAVSRRLAAMGVVDDAAFAASRTRRLHREGRSARVIDAHLREKGVSAGPRAAAMTAHGGDELAAALAFARRRRIGPFASEPSDDPSTRHRALGTLARAGFPRSVAVAALAMSKDDAEAVVARLRQT